MQELPIHYAEVEAIYNQTIGSGYRTLAITSAKAGEGKSTVAQALVERAQVVGKKMLLVEMNTFNPALSQALRESINTNVTANEIIAVEGRGYSLLPAPKDISDVLHYRESHLVLDSIKQWLADFDCIVFDSSALTSLNQSNIPAEIICDVCEGTLLVIEAGITPANLIQESVEKLKLKRVNLIGSIINDKSNPSLLVELQRETYRINHLFPKLMTKLRKKLASLVLLNIAI
jgi:Mrp family chromosome partitioning ATPase